ncbi:MAG: SMC-Scp complex subunit ScpB, partial [Sphingomonadaceae bacterium]
MSTEPPPADAYWRRVEAVLFAAAEPLSPADIRAHAGEGDLGAALAELQDHYRPRGVNLVERGGRWHFQTSPDCAAVLTAVREAPRKLGRAALETLAIIAYHEPATRAEIEEIRGVQISRGILDTLLEAELIRPAGRRESPGRPLQYATTAAFLAHFGLQSRRDLPGLAELKAAGLLEREAPAPDAALADGPA